MAGLFALSSIPGTPGPDSGHLAQTLAWTPPALQNLLHLPAYGLLAWLWGRSLSHTRLPPNRLLGLALALTLAYALFDEWHQSLVPGRFPSATDVAANALGAVLALALFRRWRLRPAAARP
jgi:VanZ family protein